MGKLHSTLTGSKLHVIGYIQSADPGAVGAGMSWIDTDDFIHRIRNDADDGWNELTADIDLSGYLPLTAGDTKPLTGDLYIYKSYAKISLAHGTPGEQYLQIMDESDTEGSITKFAYAEPATLHLNAWGSATDGGSIKVFRKYNYGTGIRLFEIYPGDGTSNPQHSFDGTGDANLCQQAGTIQQNGVNVALSTDLDFYLPLTAGSGSPLTGDLFIDTAVTPRITLTESGSLTKYGYIEDTGGVFRLGGIGTGTRQVDIVTGATSPGDALVTMFLATNTTGNSRFSIMRGDGTGIWRHRFYGNTGDVELCNGAGDLIVGSSAESHLYLDGSTNPSLFLREGGSETDYSQIYDSGGTLYIRRYDSTSASLYIEPVVGDGISSAIIGLFRNTNTTGSSDFRIYQGDGTSTQAFAFEADTGNGIFKTGNLFMDNPVNPTVTFREDADASNYFRIIQNSIGITTIEKRTAATNANIDIHCIIDDNLKTANIRLFRSTNTAGTSALKIFPGDGTIISQHVLEGSGNVDFCTLAGTFTVGDSTDKITLDREGLYLFGSCRMWDDMRVSASATSPGSSAPAVGSFLGNTRTLIFENGKTQSIEFPVQFSHRYAEGTGVEPHVHWSPDGTNTGNVKWQLEYTWAAIDAVFPATTTITALDAGAGAANTHQIADFATIDGTGKGISSILQCLLTRLGTDAEDTYTGDVFFHYFDFHYEVDSLGSDDEYVK